MKAVLISIQPKWCELIANGRKTVEVRKTKPKLETPFKVYIYCTKGETIYLPRDIFGNNALNGKVAGEFVCDEIYADAHFNAKTSVLLDNACLTLMDIARYVKPKQTAYFWHISDLVIYDKPKELSEFRKPCVWNYDCCTCEYWGEIVEDCCLDDSIKRPPQSWCYVERSDNNG